jgi:F0F1-type ATP synthase assembly protein I
MLHMGWMVALALLLPLGLGHWLDRRLGTGLLFVFVGALVGILAATVIAVRIASREIEALGMLSHITPATREKQEEGKEDTA